MREKAGALEKGSLVVWSVGLLVAGVAALAAPTVELELFHLPWQSLGEGPALVTVCAIPLGLAAGWWALWRMKRGSMGLAGRWLLLALTVWAPLLAASKRMASYLSEREYGLPFRSGLRWDYLGGMVVVLAPTLVVSGIAFAIFSLPGGKDKRTKRWQRTAAFVVMLGLLGGLTVAKRYDSQWPAVHYHRSFTMTLPEPRSLLEGERSVAQAVDETLGLYRDQVQVSVRSNEWTFSFATPTWQEWHLHADDWVQRLRILLPLDTAVRMGWSDLYPGVSNSAGSGSLSETSNPRYLRALLMVTAVCAVLAAWSGLPGFVTSGIAAAGCVLLMALPVWRRPEALDRQF